MTLLDVAPRFAADDSANCVLAHVEEARDSGHREAGSMHSANLTDSIFGKASEVLLLTARQSFGVFVDAFTPFGVHVPHVVAARPKEEMVGPYARLDVAVMENVEPIRHGAVVQRPSEAVSVVTPLGKRELAVTAPSSGSGPQPTGIGLLNFGPKARGVGSWHVAHCT